MLQLASEPKFSAGAERVRSQPWSGNRPLGRWNRLLRRTDKGTHKSSCAEVLYSRTDRRLAFVKPKPPPGDALPENCWPQLAQPLTIVEGTSPQPRSANICTPAALSTPRTFARPDFAFRVVPLKARAGPGFVNPAPVQPVQLAPSRSSRRDGRRSMLRILACWRTLMTPRLTP